MRNSYNYYPLLYKIIAVVFCFLLVILYNKSKANSPLQHCDLECKK